MQGQRVYAYELTDLQREAIEIFRDYNDFQMYPWPKDAPADDVPILLKNILRAMMDMHSTVKRQMSESRKHYYEERRDAFREGGTPR
jgi:hypothetical protein